MSDAPLPRRRPRRLPYLLGIALFLAYAAWMLGPYLRSILIRDAAVTTWSHVATTPIDGTIEFLPQQVNEAVGEDGLIAYVFNEHISQRPLELARIERERAAARVEELETHLEEIKQLDEERFALKALYARTFRDQLDVTIANLEKRIAITESLLALIGQIAERKSQLLATGSGSAADADEAQLRVHQMAFELAELEAELAFARVRRAAADEGVFATDDGDDPAWVRGSRIELKLEKKETRLELRNAQSDLARAEADLASADRDLQRLSTALIEAPEGSIVWTRRAVTGNAVLQGEGVAEWIDCGELLVDVPVSDVEAALISPGQAAEVVLEGSDRTLAATVLLVRGSAATLGRSELVALAKGRDADSAQVLLQLEDESFARCPVGQAAYVDFPDVGLLDIVLARLRL